MAPLGVIAGGGQLVTMLLEKLQCLQRPFYVIALKGFAEPAVYERYPHSVLRLGSIGEMLAILKKNAIQDIVFAGHVRRPSLMDLRPDATALRWLARLGVKAHGDDGLFKGIVGELEKEGFRVIGVHALLPQCVTMLGILGRHAPTSHDTADMTKGYEIAKDLGKWDIGQAVVVEHGLTLAVEAFEGTAQMLHRVGALKRVSPGGVLVKVAKPEQEKRIDLPAIGPDTIQQAAAAGLAGIALEAGSSLILDPRQTLKQADAQGLFIVGISP